MEPEKLPGIGYIELVRADLTLLIVMLSLFAETRLCAQITTAEGSIITNSYDTIRGKLEYGRSGLENKCVFIRPQTSKIEFLRPEEIKGFFITPDLKFVSERVAGKMLFLHVLAEGRLNLYHNGKQFYLAAAGDSISVLDGGKTRVSKDGKEYYERSIAFKSELKRYADGSLFQEINNMAFNERPLTRITRKINHQPVRPEFIAPQLSGRNHFAVEAGYSISASRGQLPSYRNNQFFRNGDPNYKHVISNWFVGLNFKRKIGTTRSYMKASLDFQMPHPVSYSYRWLLHSTFTVPNDGGPTYPADTIGHVEDLYSYDLNTILLPISYHIEGSFTRIRPFVEGGISVQYFLRNGSSLRRKVYEEDVFFEEINREQNYPFVFGPGIGFGCRYPINEKSGLSAAMNFERYYLKEGYTLSTRRLYLAYHF